MTNSAEAFDSYITLKEACAVSGLSEQTLTRFAQAEYFKSKTGSDDSLLIDRAELCSVLNIKDSKKSKLSIAKVSSPSHQEETAPLPQASDPFPTVEAAPEATNESVELIKEKQTEESSYEIQKLRALCELHEKYIEFKEKEVASLSNERDWLRARVEKLEEKGERDQVILASMSETHRALAGQMNNRKSTIQLALEWLGVDMNSSSKEK